jgi:hypothetical protein
MNDDNIFPCVLACLLFTAVGFAVGTAFGTSQFGEKFEREAIRKGHAVWITDENGYPVFKWKESCK